MTDESIESRDEWIAPERVQFSSIQLKSCSVAEWSARYIMTATAAAPVITANSRPAVLPCGCRWPG